MNKAILFSIILLCSCSPRDTMSSSETPLASNEEQSAYISIKEEEMKIQLSINEEKLTATLEQNEAGKEFYERILTSPLLLTLEEYGGFEKVGDLGFSLPRNDTRITTNKGDLILYNGNQISLMYGSNTWSYTRLGKIDDVENIALEELLGDSSINVTFEVKGE